MMCVSPYGCLTLRMRALQHEWLRCTVASIASLNAPRYNTIVDPGIFENLKGMPTIHIPAERHNVPCTLFACSAIRDVLPYALGSFDIPRFSPCLH
jgi:hypothetical protein